MLYLHKSDFVLSYIADGGPNFKVLQMHSFGDLRSSGTFCDCGAIKRVEN